jgi:hypothetical protein
MTADGQSLKAHSFVLKLSPVLQAALTGPMQEAKTSCVNMDCNEDAAQAFLKFLYTGRLHAVSLQSLDMITILVELADFYGVVNQFAAVFANEDVQKVFVSLLNSEMESADDPAKQMAALVASLRPVIEVNQRFATTVIEKMQLKFGVNILKSLCHFRAAGIADLVEACLPQSLGALLEATFVTLLEREINRESVEAILKEYPQEPSIVIDSLLAFSIIVGQAKFYVKSLRPSVGSTVAVTSYSPVRMGTIIADDSSQQPFHVEYFDGGREWSRESTTYMMNQNVIFCALSERIKLARDVVAKWIESSRVPPQ